ncbi:MAG: hypothetical protein JJT94_04970 [Bernardetiaceae bacterium]|nr:hypothetical protein [Bernardetiaceae bacterium]
MNFSILKHITQIIEQDSKDTSYKFALLRAAIEVIQEKNPYENRLESNFVELPMGSLVFKWILYYYPVIEAGIPQTSLNKRLNFQELFKEVISFYRTKGGLSTLHTNFYKGDFDIEIKHKVFGLCKAISTTIRSSPMKHIGFSIYKAHYPIFIPTAPAKKIKLPFVLNIAFLQSNFGTFKISNDYYEIFDYLGSFIIGRDSILLAWADFSLKYSQTSTKEEILNIILQEPIYKHNTGWAATFFQRKLKESGSLKCVWSGKNIRQNLHIDHVLPFSIWRNNDLWNLMPTYSKINSQKSNKIPTAALLKERKEYIIRYWRILFEANPQIFEQEITQNLIVIEDFQEANWIDIAFQKLLYASDYLIQKRGFESWNG